MNKNIKNIVSICMLITILCALLITITTLNKAENLSTTNKNSSTITNETNNPNNSFTFKNSKENINEKINFENNFGGSNNDQVYNVFKLENYYLIGTSQSSDFYFNKASKHSVFVLLCNTLGNPLNLYTYECENSISYINSKLFNNDLYILISTNCTTLLKFNLTTKQFNMAF